MRRMKFIYASLVTKHDEIFNGFSHNNNNIYCMLYDIFCIYYLAKHTQWYDFNFGIRFLKVFFSIVINFVQVKRIY